MQDLKYDTSWEEALESEEFMRSLTADLVFEAVRRRIELGLSQKDLADKINTTQSVISRFENLGRQPSISFLERIAKALDMKFSATLNGEYMYVVPYRLQSFVKSNSEVQEVPVKNFLTSTLSDYLDACARNTWKVIHTQKLEVREEQGLYHIQNGALDSPEWLPSKIPGRDILEDTSISDDLQSLAEM
ncbi:MAG: helix-turn-helix transcriptional regulator [Candidatus Aegiribacteria sp.]|nr:helix-turn-helix transcriptional regulator [Candidatus Aegiribacteria sp.]